jgi:hypothetical protein
VEQLKGLALCALAIGGVALIYQHYASRPALAATHEEASMGPGGQTVLLHLASGDLPREERHTVFERHGDCLTLRWVCERPVSASDVRVVDGNRVLFAPACSVGRNAVQGEFVREWDVTVHDAAGHDVVHHVLDAPHTAEADLWSLRQLPICSYGGMAEEL